MSVIPETQRAVQLVDRDKLVLNESAPVPRPGPYQVLCKVEAVGLCFSDLKLLKQFVDHPRKSEITSGIAAAALAEIPSYVPGPKPTVPGHEACVRVVAAGEKVPQWQPGQRYLVQADYRWILTAGANAAFGYNLEGALQEYVLMDARIIIAPNGDSTLLPASEHLSASSVALVEPWACVEDAYAERQRRTLKADGKLLMVSESPRGGGALNGLFEKYGQPASITVAAPDEVAGLPDVSLR